MSRANTNMANANVARRSPQTTSARVDPLLSFLFPYWLVQARTSQRTLLSGRDFFFCHVTNGRTPQCTA